MQRAVIQQNPKGFKELLVEGEGLRDVMTTDGASPLTLSPFLPHRADLVRLPTGVVGHLTTSNHVMEVEKILGIEAARKCIIDQIHYTMDSHGLGVDPRHLMLLGDVMCFKVRLLSSLSYLLALTFPRLSFREKCWVSLDSVSPR